MPNVFMQSGFSPGAVTKYFLLTSLMFTAIIEQSISTLILLKKVWELEFNLTNHFHTIGDRDVEMIVIDYDY